MKLISFSLMIGIGLAHVGVMAEESAAEKELQEKQLEVVRQIHELRVQLIQQDPELKRLQAQKTELHKKMSIILDSNPKMHALHRQFIELTEKKEKLKINKEK